jgi:hypothetical protein
VFPKRKAEEDDVKMRGVCLRVFELPDGARCGGFASESLEEIVEMALAHRGTGILFRIGERDEKGSAHFLVVDLGELPAKPSAGRAGECRDWGALRWGFVEWRSLEVAKRLHGSR